MCIYIRITHIKSYHSFYGFFKSCFWKSARVFIYLCPIFHRNSIPPTTTLKNLQEKLKEATGKCFVDTAFWGGVIPGNQVLSRNVVKMKNHIKVECDLHQCLLTAWTSAHDPGGSGWLQVLPHPQRSWRVPSCGWQRSAHGDEAAAGHRGRPAGNSRHASALSTKSRWLMHSLSLILQFHAEKDVHEKPEETTGIISLKLFVAFSFWFHFWGVRAVGSSSRKELDSWSVIHSPAA